ncbi:hypothetical protein NL676_029261 [Syzygium grande]|nr:hypothetical protein NL676_029261 [Syzygium grande]
MSEQNADPRPVYRRLRRRVPNAADVAMSDATDVGDVAPTGGAGPSLAAGGAGERGTKRKHGEIQSTGVEVGQMPPRQIPFDGPGYLKFLVEQHHLVQKENDSLLCSLLSDVGSAINELKKTLETNRHSFSASLESTYQELANAGGLVGNSLVEASKVAWLATL